MCFHSTEIDFIVERREVLVFIHISHYFENKQAQNGYEKFTLKFHLNDCSVWFALLR